jgi:hypothetical protein
VTAMDKKELIRLIKADTLKLDKLEHDLELHRKLAAISDQRMTDAKYAWALNQAGITNRRARRQIVLLEARAAGVRKALASMTARYNSK